MKLQENTCKDNTLDKSCVKAGKAQPCCRRTCQSERTEGQRLTLYHIHTISVICHLARQAAICLLTLQLHESRSKNTSFFMYLFKSLAVAEVFL